MKRFRIYWGDGNISCFELKNIKQAFSIASQYNTVYRVEEVRENE